MIQHLAAFLQGSLGLPWGEVVMPTYRWANPEQAGSVGAVTWQAEKIGEGWWFRRRIVGPEGSESITWAGPYDSEIESLVHIEQDKQSHSVETV